MDPSTETTDIANKRTRLKQDLDTADSKLQAFCTPHKGPNGLIPDSVRNDPNYRTLQQGFNTAFKAYRDFNAQHKPTPGERRTYLSKPASESKLGCLFSKYANIVLDTGVTEMSRLYKPLSDHPYHYKTDAELHYIIKDAGQAAVAMRDHNPEAEGKYLDQAHDANTILRYRRDGGKQSVGTYEDRFAAQEFAARLQEAVFVSRQEYDATIPWSITTKRAMKGIKRTDSLAGFTYFPSSTEQEKFVKELFHK